GRKRGGGRGPFDRADAGQGDRAARRRRGRGQARPGSDGARGDEDGACGDRAGRRRRRGGALSPRRCRRGRKLASRLRVGEIKSGAWASLRMALHLIKLAVGANDLADIRHFQRERRKERGFYCFYTRNQPRRQEEVLDGGSIYWVVKGYI